MKKSSKILFKISGILSFIFFSLYLVFSIGVLFQIPFFEDLVKTVYQSIYTNITDAELEIMLFDFVITCGFACVINFFAGKSYINLSKSKKAVYGNINTLIFILVLQFIFGASFLPCVFALIALIIYNKSIKEALPEKSIYKETDSQNTTSDPIYKETSKNLNNNQNINLISEKILELKNLLENKKITQEEYDKKFNDILSGKF